MCDMPLSRRVMRSSFRFLTVVGGSFRRVESQEAHDDEPIIHVPICTVMPLDTSGDHLMTQNENTIRPNKNT